MAQDFAQYDPKLTMGGVQPPMDEPQAIVTGVTPPAAGQVSGVTNVNLDYDPNFKKAVLSLSDNSPEGRKKTADIFAERSKQSQFEDPNEQFQPGAFLIAFLRGRLDDMHTAYNGGRTKVELGTDALGNVYKVEKNQRGFNGRMYDEETNRPLTRNEVSAVNQTRGGVITESYLNAMKTANWAMAQEAAKQAANNSISQLNATRTTAQAAANMGSATNRNIDEEVDLAIKNRHVLDFIGKLDPKQRQNLLGMTNRYISNSASINKEEQKKGSTGVSTQGQFGLGGGGFGFSGGASGSLSASQANAEAINRSNQIQDQQTLQSAIMKELQGKIVDDKQFYEFMRLVGLNDINNKALSDVPNEAKPKGFRDASPVDLFTGGMDALLTNRYVQQGNNALLSEYNKELYKSQRDAIREGKVSDPLEVQERLVQSDYYKGVENYVRQKLGILKGENPLKKGDLILDKTTGKVKRVE